MERNRSQHLSVEVQLMTEPCLWRWEIRDRDRDEVVDSSWSREWMAYESPEEALRAGRQRLTSLIRRKGAPPAPPRGFLGRFEGHPLAAPAAVDDLRSEE